VGGAVVELAEDDEMVYRAASGTAKNSVGMRLKIASSLSGLCVRENRVLRCDDTETDDRVDRDACRRIRARSMLVAPLVHRDVVVGVLKVFADQPHAFDGGDVETLRMLAGFIASSLARTAQFETNAAQLQELSRLNGALEEFSAHVAHDLRSPLAIIGMGVDTLHRMIDTPGPDVTVVLDMLRSNVNRAIELTVDLLRLARASRSPQLEWFDLGEVVEEASTDLGDVRVHNLCAAVPIEADRGAVRQALTNLLANAGRYAVGADGYAEVTVTCDASSDRWRIVVADRGPGVPEDERAAIFGAFVRGRTTTAADSTGLGLAVVAAMAQAHGGGWGCDQHEGGGAAFWFSLPRARTVLAP
jgi:signal transduction histidine kinase